MAATIFTETGFEVGDSTDNWYIQSNSGGVVVLEEGEYNQGYGPAPAPRAGTKMTNHLRKPGEGIVSGPGGARAEYGWNPAAQDGDFYWYGISIYFPSGWRLGSNTGWRIPLQFHLGDGQPGFNLEWQSGNWMWKRRVGTNTGKSTVGSPPVEEDAWNDFVVKARWRTSNDGEITAWHNGEITYQQSNIRTVAIGSVNAYMKNGLYMTSDAEGYCYSDEITLAKSPFAENENLYETVAPASGSQNPAPNPGSQLPVTQALRDYAAFTTRSGLVAMLRRTP